MSLGSTRHASWGGSGFLRIQRVQWQTSRLLRGYHCWQLSTRKVGSGVLSHKQTLMMISWLYSYDIWFGSWTRRSLVGKKNLWFFLTMHPGTQVNGWWRSVFPSLGFQWSILDPIPIPRPLWSWSLLLWSSAIWTQVASQLARSRYSIHSSINH